MLLYDIETNDGEIIEGCYFIKYMKTIRGGNSNVKLGYMPHSVQCFKHDEPIEINLSDSKVSKIYEEESGKDITKEYMESYFKVANLLGYSPEFPAPRSVINLD